MAPLLLRINSDSGILCMKLKIRCIIFKNTLLLHLLQKKGPVAEWLGRALQKLPQRFESARDLRKGSSIDDPFFVLLLLVSF